MTLQQIKEAVDSGKNVCWMNNGYQVINGGAAGYLVRYTPNGYCFGLIHQDGTMGCNEDDFFIESEYLEADVNHDPALELVTGLVENFMVKQEWKAARMLVAELLYTEPYYSSFYEEMPFSDLDVVELNNSIIILEDGILTSITKGIKSLADQLDPLPDDYEFDEPGETRENIHVQFTIGITWEKFGRLDILKEFGCQSGDNSYTGAAYGHPHWGVGTITSEHRDFNKAFELIEEMILQSLEQFSI